MRQQWKREEILRKFLKTAWKRRGTLGGSEPGATAARHRFGVAWSPMGPQLGIPSYPAEEGAERLRRGGLGREVRAGRCRQAATHCPLLPPPCSLLGKKPFFSLKQLPLRTGSVSSRSLAEAKPYPHPQCSAWVSQGYFWQPAPSPPAFPLPLSIFFPLLPSCTALASLCPRRASSPWPRHRGCSVKWATEADYCHG